MKNKGNKNKEEMQDRKKVRYVMENLYPESMDRNAIRSIYCQINRGGRGMKPNLSKRSETKSIKAERNKIYQITGTILIHGS